MSEKKENAILLDSNGLPFKERTLRINRNEYSKIISEINQIYDSQYKGKSRAAHTSFGVNGKAYVYYFENHGFNDYNIYARIADRH